MDNQTLKSKPGLSLNKVRNRKLGLSIYVVLTAFLILSITIAIIIGPVSINPITVWQIALSKLTSSEFGEFTRSQMYIVWYIRFPRVISAAFVGAGLSLVGVVIQAIVLNPLGSPYTLGISSGASMGAVAVIVLGILWGISSHFIPVGAFLGSILAFALVFFMAGRKGNFQSQRLILSGVAISYFFSAICSFFTIIAENRAAQQIIFWLLGGLSGIKWQDLWLVSGVVIFGAVFLIFQYRSLNLLLMGEETATTLGLNVNAFRKRMFFITSLITGAIVSLCGVIGFIGLILPHVCRLLVGSDHKKVIPLSCFCGSIFLIWVEVAARTILAPSEVPIGVITSIFGVPFFVWLIQTKKTM